MVLSKHSIISEFQGGVLLFGSRNVALQRLDSGHVTIEGCVSDEYYLVRDLLYQQYAIVWKHCIQLICTNLFYTYVSSIGSTETKYIKLKPKLFVIVFQIQPKNWPSNIIRKTFWHVLKKFGHFISQYRDGSSKLKNNNK